MFEVLPKKRGDLEYFVLQQKNKQISCSICPRFGANLFEFRVEGSSGTLDLIDGYQTLEKFQKNAGFKSAKLFPFPNRLSLGKYRFNEVNFQFPINFPAQGHAIHGLIHNMPFEVTDTQQNEHEAVLILETSYRGSIYYPFPFTLEMQYILNESGLEVITFVRNRGEVDMPLGDGWHPYFCFNGEKVDELELMIPPCRKILVDEQMIPTGETISFDKFRDFQPIASSEFDTGFKIESKDPIVETVIRSNKHQLELACWQENGPARYAFLQIYIPPDRRSIAIEPMTCAADAFNNAMGLVVIGANESLELKYGINIRKSFSS